MESVAGTLIKARLAPYLGNHKWTALLRSCESLPWSVDHSDPTPFRYEAESGESECTPFRFEAKPGELVQCKFFECDAAKVAEAEVAFCLLCLLREQACQKFL